MKRQPKIGLYIGAWPTNIGNAFFDLGARALLKAAVPEATFYPMGGAVHWMFKESGRRHSLNPKTKMFSLSEEAAAAHSFEIGQAAEVDLIVFAGMSLCSEFAEVNGPTFLKAAQRGVAVMGLGAGAAAYTEEEAEIFSSFFGKIERHALITRDEDTFTLFNGKIQQIRSGIDCAFFLPDHYTPPKLDLPVYDVENFDATVEYPSINHYGRMLIHTHHDMWGPLPVNYINRSNSLVSDIPEDYLTLYSQVEETHSNRVHACIATLAYGNKARLYNSTPRKSLFAKVGAEQVISGIGSLDMSRLKELKHQQILQTRSMIEDLIG